MPNTELHDLVASLGAVYWQDPQVPEGYTLSGSSVTNVVNLIDGVSIPENGTNTINIGTVCTQDVFRFNPEGTSSTTRINRSPYTAVTSCLQTDWTLFAVGDQNFNSFILGHTNVAVNSPFVNFLLTVGTSGAQRALQVRKRKITGGSTETHKGSNISLVAGHHVYEIVCTNTTWDLLVDGVSTGSGTWANSGSAYSTPIINFYSGQDLPSSSTSVTRSTGQMALFPSVLSASDRARVRDAMALIMCNGHPSGDNAPWWGTDF